METGTMGKVLVSAVIENLEDLFKAKEGKRADQEVRRVEVPDALVDTGAFGLLLPKRMINALGLEPLKTREAMTAAGPVELTTYRAVRLSVQGRDCILDVTEIRDDCPVLIGQLPLEMMDWVVDPKKQQLIGNPAHGGEHILEVY
jgi:clan AA aspartic protease